MLDLWPDALEFADGHDFKRGLTGGGGWRSISADAPDGEAVVAHGVDTDAIWVGLVFGREDI